MNFTIPQFIDMESKVVGPLTFRQFVFIAIGTTLSFVVYLTLGKTNMTFALAIVVVIEGVACTFAFVKMNGIGLATVLKHYLAYSASPRMYLWKNLELPNQVIVAQEKVVIQKAPCAVQINLTTEKGSLKKMRDYLETA